MSSITEGKARIFQAHAPGKASRSADTPREAARHFFEANPRARKCDVQEGFTDGFYFSVIYGGHLYQNETVPRWPRSWDAITLKTIDTALPEHADPIVMYGQTQAQLDAKYPRAPLEITREQWWELLEVLPPAAWVRRGPNESFHLSEIAYGDIALHCVKVGERYFRFHMHEHTTHDELVRHALGSPQ